MMRPPHREESPSLTDASTDRNGPAPVKLSISQVTTYHWSLLDVVTACREFGIPGIGLWRPRLTEFGEERGIELLMDSGLRVANVCWAGGFTGADGTRIGEALVDAYEAVATAAAVQADCLVVVSGSRGGHTLNHARRLVVDSLKQLADVAAEAGVTLALVPLSSLCDRWTFLHSLDAAMEILDRVAHPSVRLAIDLYHLWRENEPFEQVLEFADQVATVHLSDGRLPARSRTDRLLPGEGDIPLAEWVRRLAECGYEGFFDIQVWSESVWQRDYGEVLRHCRDWMQAVTAAVSDPTPS